MDGILTRRAACMFEWGCLGANNTNFMIAAPTFGCTRVYPRSNAFRNQFLSFLSQDLASTIFHSEHRSILVSSFGLVVGLLFHKSNSCGPIFAISPIYLGYGFFFMAFRLWLQRTKGDALGKFFEEC